MYPWTLILIVYFKMGGSPATDVVFFANKDLCQKTAVQLMTGNLNTSMVVEATCVQTQ